MNEKNQEGGIDLTVGLEEYSLDYASYLNYPELLHKERSDLSGLLDRLSARKGETETLVHLIEEESSRALDTLLPQFISNHSEKLLKAFEVVDAIDALVCQLGRAAGHLEQQLQQAESKSREREWSESLRNLGVRMFGGIATEHGDLEHSEFGDFQEISSSPSSSSSSFFFSSSPSSSSSASSSPSPSSLTFSSNDGASVPVDPIPDTQAYFERLRADPSE